MIKYYPRCKYCDHQNKIELNEPINYQCCSFYCDICHYHNIKDIRISKEIPKGPRTYSILCENLEHEYIKRLKL